MLCFAESRPVDQATRKTVTRLGVRGTSTLRRVLRRSGYSTQYRAQMAAWRTLWAGSWMTAAALMQLTFEPSAGDQKRLRSLVRDRRKHRSGSAEPENSKRDSVRPRSRTLEWMFHFCMRWRRPCRSFLKRLRVLDRWMSTCRSHDDVPRSNIRRSIARIVKPEYLKFALKGCLAATACYVIYNSIAWPGI